MASKNTYSFYGVTEYFQKELLFTCSKDERNEAKQLIPPTKKIYIFIISDYNYVTYPYDNESMDGFIYHDYTILDFELNKKFQILKNFRISPLIKHTWMWRMRNQYVEYELEDTNNGEKTVLKMSNSGDLDKVLDGLRLINTYGLTLEVMERMNNFNEKKQ